MDYYTISPENYTFFEALLPTLYRDQFMSDPSIQGFGAVDEGTACGIILYTEDSDLRILHIIYIAVSMPCQRRHIATDMLLTLSREAYDRGFMPMALFFAANDQAVIYRLFEKSGMFTIVGRSGSRVVLVHKDLNTFFKEHKKVLMKIKDPACISFRDMTTEQKGQLVLFLRENCPDPKISAEDLDHELTAAVFVKGQIRTVIAASRSFAPRGYYISWLFSNQKKSLGAVKILFRSFKAAYMKMRPTEYLVFQTLASSGDALSARFFGEDAMETTTFMAGYNGPYAV